MQSFVQNKKSFNALFGYFGAGIKKNVVIFQINALEFVLLQSLVQIQKFLNLGPKMPFLGILGSNFEKLFVTFEINAFEFFSLQSLVQKRKSLSLRSKISDLRVLG